MLVLVLMLVIGQRAQDRDQRQKEGLKEFYNVKSERIRFTRGSSVRNAQKRR